MIKFCLEVFGTGTAIAAVFWAVTRFLFRDFRELRLRAQLAEEERDHWKDEAIELRLERNDLETKLLIAGSSKAGTGNG